MARGALSCLSGPKGCRDIQNQNADASPKLHRQKSAARRRYAATVWPTPELVASTIHASKPELLFMSTADTRGSTASQTIGLKGLQMTRFTIAMIFGAIALTTASAPASAQVSEKVVVKYNDLDLRTAEGARTFHRRLQQAITQVCGDFDASDPVRTGDINACRDQMQLSIANMERQKIDAARTATQVAFAQAKPVH